MSKPESDTKLCDKLAEWRGWKWMRWHDLDYKSPDGPLRRTLVKPDSQWLESPDWVECDLSDPRQRALQANSSHVPRPDIDIDAALKLLDWLVSRPEWDVVSSMYSSQRYSHVEFWRGQQSCGRVKIEGPPPEAMPKAIALAAYKVLEAERGE